MKRVALFGSTGSIGTQALEVLTTLGSSYSVTALAAGHCTDAFRQQVKTWRPSVVAIGVPEEALAFEQTEPGWRGRVLSGPEGLAAAVESADTVINGITGYAGLPVSLAAVTQGKRLALANKESLVAAGPLLMGLAAKHGAEVIPVDSEHSAIFQCLRSGSPSEVERIILTASGGPFRSWDRARVECATIDDALNHPTWKMGPKISIDSATLMNKALEVIEARWIFNLPANKIEVVVHPQSIIHSMVLFQDRSMIAQLGLPTMKVPIQYALTHPERASASVATWSIDRFQTLNFEEPRHDVFPALRLGMHAAAEGGLLGTVLNAANEVAVAEFLAGKIRFLDITQRVASTMDRWRGGTQVSLEAVKDADAWARRETVELCRC